MFGNLRKRLEDSLEAVEALATNAVLPASPVLSRQDSISSLNDATSGNPAPVRHSLDTPSPTQHSAPFNYLPYQPRSAVQLSDSVSNLRRSLTLQRTGSANSGQPDPLSLDRKASRGSMSERENSPVHAPAPRRAGLSLEERLRANFTAGDTSGSTSPADRVAPNAKALDGSSTAVGTSAPADPEQIPLPPSPIEEGAPKPTLPLDEAVDPASVHLPMSPPPQGTNLSTSLNALAAPHNGSLSPSPVTFHPLSPPPPESAPPNQGESSAPAQEGVDAHETPLSQPSQVKQAPPRPANIIVDVSTPSSAMVTPSDFATAESRSDVTVGSPSQSKEDLAVDALDAPLSALEAQETPITPAAEPLPEPTSDVQHITPTEPQENEDQQEHDISEVGVPVQEDADAKVRDRLKVVEERFNDVSTSFKRLQAEKVAADKLIREVSPLEGLSDLEGFRAYLMNQKMKIEISGEEIKRLTGQIRQQEERLEEVREMHKMESSSQSDLVEKLRQQLSESEALLKVVESDSAAHKTTASQHEVEIERLKGGIKDEEEKRTKAITLLKTVRQKLTKAEKERDDVMREREKDKEDISAARAEIERVRADAERAKNERERDIAGMRDRFERELRETKERYEKEIAARKGQYELEAITTKAAHSKELSAKTTRVASLESTIAGLVNEKDTLFDQCQTRQAEAESAQSHLQTVQNQLNEMQYQLREAEERNSLLTDELDELRNGSRLSTHSPTPSPEVARLLSEAEGKFEARLSEMRAKIRAMEKERNEAEDDWNKTLADRSKEIEKLRFSLRQAEDKWIESGRVGKGMDEKLAALEQNVKELQAQREGWQQERTTLEEQLKKVQGTLHNLEGDRAEALERASSIEAQFEESKNRETSLRMSNKTLRDELRKVQSSVALLERQRPTGVGFWSASNSGTPTTSKAGNGVTSPISPRPSSPVSEVGSTSAKQEEDVNLEYIRNVILQFLEHKEMRPNLVRVLSTILRFTPQETRRLIAKV